MNKRLLKLTLITLVAAAVTALAPSSRADDTTAPATPSDQSSKLKFYGPITAVDTNAMTFTVGDQTFIVTSSSQMTKNGQTATIADATVGEPARGSYTKGDDGKLDVTKVRFGKKSGGKAGGKHKKSESSDTDTNTPPSSAQQ
jgi:hypothetical protein